VSFDYICNKLLKNIKKMENQLKTNNFKKNNQTSKEDKKKKRDKILWKVVFILFGFVFLLIIIVAMSPDEPEIKPTKAEIHKQNIEKLFSAWDGSHINLKAKIQEGLNDPNSYENISTNYWDRDSLIVVKTIYTAKNEYGGVIKTTVMIESDTLGNILKVY